MAYQSNLLGNLWTGYRQRRATGGRTLTSAEMRGLLDPIASSEARKSIAAGDRAQRQANIDRRFGLMERAYDDRQSAAKVSGMTDIAGMGLAYKLGSQRNQIMSGLLGGANEGVKATAAANFVPGVAGQAYSAAGTPVLATEAFGGAAVEAGGGGLLGAAGTAAPYAAGGWVGSQALQGMGVGKDVAESVSYTAAGALAGSVIPGLGTAAGAAVGFGISLLDDVFGGLF